MGQTEGCVQKHKQQERDSKENDAREGVEKAFSLTGTPILADDSGPHYAQAVHADSQRNCGQHNPDSSHKAKLFEASVDNCDGDQRNEKAQATTSPRYIERERRHLDNVALAQYRHAKESKK